MVVNKWILGVRNKLADFSAQMDSCAAIEGAKMTESEREYLQKRLREDVKWLDKKLFNDK